MKAKLILSSILLILVACSKSNLTSESAAQIIRQTLQIPENIQVDIQGIAEESRNSAIVKFTANKEQFRARMRKYDRGWQMDDIQGKSGEWIPIASLYVNDRLDKLEERVFSNWDMLCNCFQRRSDLIPNLVDIAKGIGSFETEALMQLANARLETINLKYDKKVTENPELFADFQNAQNQLSINLSRFIEIFDKYPGFNSNQNIKDININLEGTENRIEVEVSRYNEAAQEFNAALMKSMSGIINKEYKQKQIFELWTKANQIPIVKFY